LQSKRGMRADQAKLSWAESGLSWLGRARQVIPQAVEERHFLGVKLHVGSGQTSRQLLRFCGPDNCRGDGRLRQHPCHRHLHQRLAAFLEKGFEAIDRLKLRVLPVPTPVQVTGRAERETAAGFWPGLALVFARQESALPDG